MMLKYFVLSGAIMGLIACVKYKKIAKEFPILEMIGLPAFVIGNTLLGFIALGNCRQGFSWRSLGRSNSLSN